MARVVLRLPDGHRVSASTFAAGWAGLRLWTVNLPVSARVMMVSGAQSHITATGYDAAGHVVGQITLGGIP